MGRSQQVTRPSALEKLLNEDVACVMQKLGVNELVPIELLGSPGCCSAMLLARQPASATNALTALAPCPLAR